MVAFSSATKNGMMECGKFHAMRLMYAEKSSSCILYCHGGRATTMNFTTMQRLTGHDNTPDAPGQATSTGDSLAGRPASWWYFAAEQPRVAGLPIRHTRRRRMWAASLGMGIIIHLRYAPPGGGGRVGRENVDIDNIMFYRRNGRHFGRAVSFMHYASPWIRMCRPIDLM